MHFFYSHYDSLEHSIRTKEQVIDNLRMTPESTATAVAPYAAELLTLWKRSHRDTHKAIIFRDGDQDQQRFCDALNTQLAVMGLKHPRTKKPLRAVV